MSLFAIDLIVSLVLFSLLCCVCVVVYCVWQCLVLFWVVVVGFKCYCFLLLVRLLVFWICLVCVFSIGLCAVTSGFIVVIAYLVWISYVVWIVV